MKKILILFCILWAGKGFSQSTLVNSGGAKIVIATGTDFKADNLRNDGTGSQIINNGTLYLNGSFKQTNTATYAGSGAGLIELAGTTQQTLESDALININRLTINNTAGAKLMNSDMTIADALNITAGDFDLNGQNIDLGTTGVLVENRVLNHLIVDKTIGLNETNKGGYIRVTNRTTTSTLTQIAGLGIHLADAGTVSIDRYHYKATGILGGSILKNYELTGTPSNATLRIEFASDELGGITPNSTFKLFRYNGTTWENKGGTWTNAAVDYVEQTLITAFSPWTVGSESQPLPITLVSFNASRINTEEVQLTWATATEINNKGFEVEQSEDGITYKKIAFIDGRGNSTTIQQYSHTTIQPNSNYYRLKQIDFDGKFSYSPIRFVEGIASKLYFAPNPTTNEVHLQGNIKADEILNLEVVGTDGQILWRGKGKATEVENSLNIALRSFKAGLYLFHLQVNGKMTVQKMVKQ